MKYFLLIAAALSVASCGGEVAPERELTSDDKARIETAQRLGRGCIINASRFTDCQNFCNAEFSRYVEVNWNDALLEDKRAACLEGVRMETAKKSLAVEMAQ